MSSRVLRWIAVGAAGAVLLLAACTPPLGFPALGQYGAHVTCKLPSGNEEGVSTDGYVFDSSQSAYTFTVSFITNDADQQVWARLTFWLPDIGVGTYTLADRAPATDYAMLAWVRGIDYYAGSGPGIDGSTATVTVSGESEGVIWGTFEATLKNNAGLAYAVSDGRFSASPR